MHADYRDLDRVLDARGIPQVDGALADLGVSSMQLAGDGRGFSFQRDEPLDMRMDQSSGADGGRPAGDGRGRGAGERDLPVRRGASLAAHRPRHRAGAVAGAGRRRRASSPQIVRRAIPGRGYQRIDPATRTFQALRIWVNRELDGLDVFVAAAAARLAAGARLAIIAFHSLEDRIVKHTFRALAQGEAALRILTKRPIEAGDDEVDGNPRARSAKLRAIERLA